MACNNNISIAHSNDVLLARKSITKKHHGNQILACFIEQKKDEYQNAFFREQKKLVAQDIVNKIKKLNPPGRFLELKNKSFTQWHEVDHDKCISVVCQKIREVLKNGGKGNIKNTKQIASKDEQSILPSNVISTSNPLTAAAIHNQMRASKIAGLANFRHQMNIPVNSKWTRALEGTAEKIEPPSLKIDKDRSIQSNHIVTLSNGISCQGSLKRKILDRKNGSDYSVNESLSGIHSTALTNRPKEENLRKKTRRSLVLGANKRTEGSEDLFDSCHHKVLASISFVAQSFLAKSVCGAKFRDILEKVTALHDDEHGVMHLPYIVARLIARIEKLEGGNSSK